MRTSALVVSLAWAATAVAAGPRISPDEALLHRGELVTLVGPVSQVEHRDRDVVLTLGTTTRVAVVLPSTTASRLSVDPAEMTGQTIEVEGFLPQSQPLTIVVDQPDRLTVGAAASPTDSAAAAQEKVRKLEAEVTRLRARTESTPREAKTYGPTRPTGPVPPNAMQAHVLAERGIPDRVEWGAKGRTLVYGRTRYVFDDHGQLIDTRTDR